jgi:hypothetical protein
MVICFRINFVKVRKTYILLVEMERVKENGKVPLCGEAIYHPNSEETESPRPLEKTAISKRPEQGARLRIEKFGGFFFQSAGNPSRWPCHRAAHLIPSLLGPHLNPRRSMPTAPCARYGNGQRNSAVLLLQVCIYCSILQRVSVPLL